MTARVPSQAARDASAGPCGFAGTPEGYVLVPRVPTKAMLSAAADTPGMQTASAAMEMQQFRGYGFAAGSFDAGSPLEQAWAAMVAAAEGVRDA